MFNKQSPQTTKDLADILAIIKTNVRTADKVNDLTIKTATEFLTLLKILKAKETNLIGPVGQIIDKNFIIGCLKNSIQVLEVKKEGKNKMKALDFLRGNNLKVGTNVN